MTLGHEGDHQNGQHIWHQAQGNYRSTNLAGASHDDLIRDLFRRVEILEQTSAGGAATDDMFSGVSNALDNHAKKITELRVQVRDLEQLARPTASCASEELRQGLGEVEKRMTRLEQAQVYGPGPHDLSALQASITNHVNRALTDLGSALNTQFERLNGAICQVNGDAQLRNQAMVDRLSAMWDVLGAMTPIIDSLVPEQPRCGTRILFSGDQLCVLGSGHDGPHQGEEPVTHVDTGLDYTTERASGSPAAVRCPTRFREGQCLGYAGHDGECSAIQGGEQLEDPGEFTESTYDRSSDGTPLEES